MTAFQPFLQRFAEAGLACDLDAVGAMVLFPWVVYADGRPHLFLDAGRLALHVAACGLALRRAGVALVEVRIVARPDGRGPRHALLTETAYLDSARARLGTCRACVFVRESASGPRIAMVDMRRPAVPAALGALLRGRAGVPAGGQ